MELLLALLLIVVIITLVNYLAKIKCPKCKSINIDVLWRRVDKWTGQETKQCSCNKCKHEFKTYDNKPYDSGH